MKSAEYEITKRAITIARKEVAIIGAYIDDIAEIRRTARLSFMSLAESDAVGEFPANVNDLLSSEGTIFEVYDRIDLAGDIMYHIKLVVSSDECMHRATFERSSTFSDSLFAKRTRAESAILRYSDAINSACSAVSAVDSPISAVISAVKTLKAPIGGQYLINCMRRIFRETDVVHPAILAIYEEMKDRALETEHVEISESTVKQYLCRGELRPITVYMSAGNLENYIHIHDSVDISISAKTVSSGASLIIIGSPAGEIHEYNIAGLNDNKYITRNNMDLPYFCGVNNRVIARYRIISRADDAIDHSNSGISIYGERNSAKWIVIESPNFGTYRQLGIVSPNRRTTLEFADVKSLVDSDFTARHQTYNDLHSGVILSRWYAPDANRILVDFEHDKKSAQVSNFARTLVSAVITEFRAIIGRLPKLSRKAADRVIIDNKWVAEIVMTELMKTLPESADEEIVMGRIAKAIPIASSFRQTLAKRWATYSENMNDITQLDAFFGDVLIAAVDDMFESAMMVKFEVGVKEYFCDEFKAPPVTH